MKKKLSTSLFALSLILSATQAFADNSDLLDEATIGGGISGGKQSATGGLSGIGGGTQDTNSGGLKAEFNRPFYGGGNIDGYGDIKLNLGVNHQSNGNNRVTTDSHIDLNGPGDSGMGYGFTTRTTATNSNLLVTPVGAGISGRPESGNAEGAVYVSPWSYMRMRDSGIGGNFGGLSADGLYKLGNHVALIVSGNAGVIYGMHRSLNTNVTSANSAVCNSGANCYTQENLTTTETQPGFTGGTGGYVGGSFGVEFKVGQSGLRMKAEVACDEASASGKYTHLVTGTESNPSKVSASDCSADVMAYKAF